MRVGARGDREPRLLQRRDRVGRRHLDPVDLARAEGGDAGVGLRDRQQADPVDLGRPFRVPIAVVAGEIDGFARHHPGDLERAGAGRRQRRNLGPVAPRLLEGLRRGEQQVDHHGGEVRGHLRGGDLHRLVVYLPVGADDGRAGPGDARALRLELRAVVLVVAVEVPDHRVRVERRAVVELDALAQVEGPELLVGGILLPALGQRRDDPRELVRALEVPLHQTLEDRVAEEAHPLEAVVGHARGCRMSVAVIAIRSTLSALGRTGEGEGACQRQGGEAVKGHRCSRTSTRVCAPPANPAPSRPFGPERVGPCAAARLPHDKAE